jgi:hypothetical protein
MAARNNALAEITRLWLQTRHGCLVDESVPIPVPYALSDIDLIAIRPDLQTFALPDGTTVGPRLIVEMKDEHDWEPTGKEFGKSLIKDIQKMEQMLFIPKGTKEVKFTMLREEHYEKATSFFGTNQFDRLLALHAISADAKLDLAAAMAERRIHVVTIKEIAAELLEWYRLHPRKAALRHTLTGDIWHLLVGFCGYKPPS